jgi:hypothetical protein
MKQCQHPGVAVTVDGAAHHVMPESAREFFNTEVLAKV